MYIDAVERMVNKLKEPKLKSSRREEISAELKSIDPAGELKAFVERGRTGSRPNMDHLAVFASVYQRWC
jgi:hypothetical protein